MRKLKIGYFADGPWSWRALELIANDSHFEIVFVVARTNSEDQTLKNLAKKYSIPYIKGYKINTPEFMNEIRNYDFNLLVSMSFDQIFKKDILALPEYGTINCHAGKLPFYRGRNILNWAIINDEKEFGVTVHYIDEGIDTGDIITQKVVPITDEDDYQTLLVKAYELCATSLYESLVKISKDEVKRTRQDSIHPVGFYCGIRKVGDEIINWNQTSRELFNFIRAITTPGPCAETYLNGCIVKIVKAKLVENAPVYKGTVGQILKKTPSGFLVKTSDSFIEVVSFQSEVTLKVGDRFQDSKKASV